MSNDTKSSKKVARLTRRRWLQSSVAAVALPSLEIMTPKGAVAQDSPQNFMVYYLPNGRMIEDWRPSRNADGTLKMTKTNSALQPWADRMAVGDHLQNQPALDSAPGAAHARGTSTVLTGSANDMKKITNHISIDQIIANEIGKNSPFKSLQYTSGQKNVGDRCDVDGTACIYTQCISWAGKGKPLAPNQNLKSAFDQLFGPNSGFKPVDSDPNQSAGNVQSILDTVIADATDLKNALGTSDQQRLEQYFDGLRDIERRLQSATGGANCSINGWNPDENTFESRVEAFHDLMVLALSCGQTKVVSYMIDWGLTMRRYNFINANDPHHSSSHFKNPENREKLRRIEKWQAERVASFLKKMEDTQGAQGKSLLEETLVLIQPSMGRGNGHDHRRVTPMLIGGDGRIKTDGRFFERQALGNLGASLLDAYDIQGNFGRKGARFGDKGTSSIAGLFSNAKPNFALDSSGKLF